MDFNVMLQRAIRAARLDVSVYEELERDTSLTNEAITFVAIVAVISGIGSFLNTLLRNGLLSAVLGFIVSVIVAVLLYFVWAFLNFFIGTNLFKGQATDYTRVLRPLGYAYGPQALGLLVFVPCIGPLASLAGALWMAVAGFVAIRQSLDLDNTNAILTIVISFIVFVIITAIIGAILGAIGLAGAFGFGALTGTLGR
jgi:hypothetical protein